MTRNLGTLILGAGKMVEAILQGLSAETDLSDFGIYSPSGTSAARLASELGLIHVSDLNAVSPGRIIVGCKPQQLRKLKEGIGDRFNSALFISLLAAVPEDIQRQVLGAEKLVRLMPNLPVKYRAGVCLLSSTSAAEELASLQRDLNPLGKAIIVPESALEELTLLCGSGPALFYEFTRDLAASFSSVSPENAEVLARMVLKGAGISVSEDPSPLSDLINAVTSRGGVTIAVLEKWRASGFKALVESGIEAGGIRSEEIRKTILQS